MTNAHLVAWLRAFAESYVFAGDGDQEIVLEAARVIDAIPDAPASRRPVARHEEDVPLPWPERYCR